jgi:phosphoheptose isomerase
MKFPNEAFATARDYAANYFAAVSAAHAAVDPTAIGTAADVLSDLFSGDGTLYVCGNGGSAAISNHLLCDFTKGIQTDTVVRPRVVSMSAHLELITAIGNDIEFAEIFAYQLRTAARPGDGLLTISASGDSENVVRAAAWARANGIRTIALTGFSGGRTAELSDVNIHVPAANYGIVEDVHQSVMHILAQYLRIRSMDPLLVPKRYF